MHSPRFFSPSLVVTSTILLLLPAHENLANAAAAFVATPSTRNAVPPTTFQSPFSSSTNNEKYNRSSCKPTSLLHASGSGFGNTNNNNTNKLFNKPSITPTAELFELQELRAQLQTILKDNILYQSLSTEKRQELTKYVKAVLEKTKSPIEFNSGGGMGTAQFVAGLENRSWRMVFVTDDGGDASGANAGEGESAATSNPSELPYGSTVILRMKEFMGADGTLDYVLKFSKRVLGLNELVAKSTCSVDIGPINPGVLSFQYQDIKTNVFGISDLPVGFFGLLKGRVNYIDTVWFDGERWIERNYLENGDVVYSLYVRDEEDEKNA